MHAYAQYFHVYDQHAHTKCMHMLSIFMCMISIHIQNACICSVCTYKILQTCDLDSDAKFIQISLNFLKLCNNFEEFAFHQKSNKTVLRLSNLTTSGSKKFNRYHSSN